MVEGQFKDCSGTIKQIHDGFVHFITEESKPVEIKAKGFQVRKLFRIGESVRIIQGNRAGEAGIITRIMRNSDGLDSHATVTMIEDSSHSDLTVLINNLRLRQDIDPSIQGNLFQKNLNHVNYYAGELILYEGKNKKGLIIQTSADSLNVLNE